jgi:hypothetical protein
MRVVVECKTCGKKFNALIQQFCSMECRTTDRCSCGNKKHVASKRCKDCHWKNSPHRRRRFRK